MNEILMAQTLRLQTQETKVRLARGLLDEVSAALDSAGTEHDDILLLLAKAQAALAPAEDRLTDKIDLWSGDHG